MRRRRVLAIDRSQRAQQPALVHQRSAPAVVARCQRIQALNQDIAKPLVDVEMGSDQARRRELVIVEKHQHLAVGQPRSPVGGCGRAGVSLGDPAKRIGRREVVKSLGRSVGGSIDADDDLQPVRRDGLRLKRFEGLGKDRPSIERRDHHRGAQVSHWWFPEPS